jgi:hypothetical protein
VLDSTAPVRVEFLWFEETFSSWTLAAQLLLMETKNIIVSQIIKDFTLLTSLPNIETVFVFREAASNSTSKDDATTRLMLDFTLNTVKISVTNDNLQRICAVVNESTDESSNHQSRKHDLLNYS